MSRIVAVGVQAVGSIALATRLDGIWGELVIALVASMAIARIAWLTWSTGE